MEEFKLKILKIVDITHDVRAYQLAKPAEYQFIPGQAADVAINKLGLIDQKRPFTFTSLNSWNFLEFIIKSYNDHDGITKQIGKLSIGDELIVSEPWGSIRYKGPGTFIAGGAGVTPFIAIIRDLFEKKLIEDNKLIFANKTAADIILKKEFEYILGQNLINILSEEKSVEHHTGFISSSFIKEHLNSFNKYFYVCGPPPMMDSVENIFKDIKVNPLLIVKEEF